MKKINIGILGCASIAERSMIPAIQNLNKLFNLCGIASRNYIKANEFAKKFHCKAYLNYEELIFDNGIDALYIPLPTGLHFEWVKKALANNKHLYIEKSFAKNLVQANLLVQDAKNRELTIFEGYMFQYHQQHQTVKEIIKKGEIGEIRYFSSKFGFPPLNENNFRYDPILGGGALLDAAGYTIKAARMILGKEMEIKAATLKFNNKNTNNEINIFGAAFMTNNDGVAASLAFGFDNYYQCDYEIWGTKGKIIVNKAFTPKPDQTTKIIIESNYISKEILIEAENHFEKALIEFYKSIFDSEKTKNLYNDILIQSKDQDKILKISKINNQ